MRFPEFKAEWKRKKLGEVAEITKGKGISKEQLSLKGTLCILYGELYTKYKFEIISEVISRTDINVAGLIKSKSNDVLIPASGETAIDISTTRCIYSNDVLIGGDINILRLKNDNGTFLSYQLNEKRKLDIAKIAQGISVVHLYGKKLRSLYVFFPDLNEQTKIASFLSLIDERIQTQMKIIEEWEKLKKGMIDELFLQKLILKEFDNEWEEISIGAIGTVVTGGTPSKKESKFWGGDFAWVTAQDFTEKYIYNSVLKLTDKGKKKSRTIPRNSVLVTCIASIGLNGINKVECAINQQINAIICNPLNYYEFIYYAILANTERLKNLAGQTAVPIINKSVFEKFTISKPKSLKEQQKIASILSSFDKKLKIERQILTQYQNQKKYLLQNMFI